jgi:hypothetical protein
VFTVKEMVIFKLIDLIHDLNITCGSQGHLVTRNVFGMFNSWIRTLDVTMALRARSECQTHFTKEDESNF